MRETEAQIKTLSINLKPYEPLLKCLFLKDFKLSTTFSLAESEFFICASVTDFKVKNEEQLCI